LANVFIADRDQSSAAEALSNKINLFIDDNIHKGVTLKLLSQFLGCSEKYCSELFYKTMGKPFSGYLKHRRLEQAAFMLTASKKDMAGIDSALGFSDQFAFSHFFKRATGQSPIQFRSQHGRRRR
jgi:AraC-like DNA-binding protein